MLTVFLDCLASVGERPEISSRTSVYQCVNKRFIEIGTIIPASVRIKLIEVESKVNLD
jgi:hypothetical protein